MLITQVDHKVDPVILIFKTNFPSVPDLTANDPITRKAQAEKTALEASHFPCAALCGNRIVVFQGFFFAAAKPLIIYSAKCSSPRSDSETLKIESVPALLRFED